MTTSGLLNWRNGLYNTLVTYELLRGIDGIEVGGYVTALVDATMTI